MFHVCNTSERIHFSCVLSDRVFLVERFEECEIKTMSFNKIIVVGNLGRDPEMRYTPQGTPVCTFSIASNERRKTSAGEQQDITTWFRVTVWGKQAETVS